MNCHFFTCSICVRKVLALDMRGLVLGSRGALGSSGSRLCYKRHTHTTYMLKHSVINTTMPYSPHNLLSNQFPKVTLSDWGRHRFRLRRGLCCLVGCELLQEDCGNMSESWREEFGIFKEELPSRLYFQNIQHTSSLRLSNNCNSWPLWESLSSDVISGCYRQE